MFESELRGTPGVDKVEVDNQGRAVNVVEVKKPEAGHDVQLTVDLPSQHIAEESLAAGHGGRPHARRPRQRQLLHGQRRRGGRARRADRVGGGDGVEPELRPQRLHLRQLPTSTSRTPTTRCINRALNPYAPGSTFKMFTSLAMLQSGLYPDGANHVDDDDPTAASTSGTTRSAATRGRRQLGAVDLPTALTVSSDVYFYTRGQRVLEPLPRRGPGRGLHRRPGRRQGARRRAPGRQRHPAHRARPTASASRPASASATSPASSPTTTYRVKVNTNNPDNQFWRRGDSASLAVGQGDVLVTPLQLADAYATFANGGTLYVPRLVDEVHAEQRRAPAGQLGAGDHTIDPQVRRTTGLTPDVRGADRRRPRRRRDQRRTAPRSARSATTRAVHVIGKTGTAQRAPNAGHVVVRGDHQPGATTPPCRSTWSSRWSSRAASAPTSPRRSCAGSSTTSTTRPRPPAAVVVAPPTATSRATDVDDQPEPHRPARQQRRGLGEPSRLEASPLRHFDWLLVGAALAITAIGLVMIYSTTHHRIPGDPYYFVKRQALFAVIGFGGDGRRAADRLPAPARLLDGVLRRHRVPAARGARAGRLEHQGSPGVVPAPGRVHAPAVGAGQVRDHRGPRRLLQPVPRRARRLAPHRDHRAGLRARSAWCCSSPTSAP